MKEKEWCLIKKAVHVYGLTLTGFLFGQGSGLLSTKKAPLKMGRKLTNWSLTKCFSISFVLHVLVKLWRVDRGLRDRGGPDSGALSQLHTVARDYGL